jgi:hypothetical protein
MSWVRESIHGALQGKNQVDFVASINGEKL